MMAQEHKEYWKEYDSVGIMPPDAWTRVIVPTNSEDTFTDVSNELLRWMNSDSIPGFYCWHYYDHFDNTAQPTTLILAFSNRDAAFECKMRFG